MFLGRLLGVVALRTLSGAANIHQCTCLSLLIPHWAPLLLPFELCRVLGPLVVGWEQFGGNGAVQPLELTYHRHFYALGEHYNSTEPI